MNYRAATGQRAGRNRQLSDGPPSAHRLRDTASGRWNFRGRLRLPPSAPTSTLTRQSCSKADITRSGTACDHSTARRQRSRPKPPIRWIARRSFTSNCFDWLRACAPRPSTPSLPIRRMAWSNIPIPSKQSYAKGVAVYGASHRPSMVTSGRHCRVFTVLDDGDRQVMQDFFFEFRPARSSCYGSGRKCDCGEQSTARAYRGRRDERGRTGIAWQYCPLGHDHAGGAIAPRTPTRSSPKLAVMARSMFETVDCLASTLDGRVQDNLRSGNRRLSTTISREAVWATSSNRAQPRRANGRSRRIRH